MTLPSKCLVDTNVPKTANLALTGEIPPGMERRLERSGNHRSFY